MIIVRKLASVITLLVACSSLCAAQDSLRVATSQQKSEVIASRMERELSLSKAQTQRISVILLERFETLSKNTGDKNQQLATANDIAVKKLAEVLTAKQLALYNEARSDTKRQKAEYLKKNPSYKFTDLDKEMDF